MYVPENGAIVQLLPYNGFATQVLSVTANHGQTVTFIGGGSSSSTNATLSPGLNTAETVEVLLRNNQVWVGLRNAVINFTVFKVPNKTYLIEASRG